MKKLESLKEFLEPRTKEQMLEIVGGTEVAGTSSLIYKTSSNGTTSQCDSTSACQYCDSCGNVSMSGGIGEVFIPTLSGMGLNLQMDHSLPFEMQPDIIHYSI